MNTKLMSFGVSFGDLPSPRSLKNKKDRLHKKAERAGGSIIGGFLIIFLNRYINHSESNSELITVLLIFFAVFWIVSAMIGHKLYISALISNLKSDDKETAFDAIESLGEPFCKKSLNALLELVKSKDVDFKKRALLSLPLTYNPCVYKIIRECISDDNEVIRVAAVDAEKLLLKKTPN